MVELLSTESTPMIAGTDREFVKQVEKMVSTAKPVFDPISQKMMPFVNTLKLRRAMKVGFRGNVLPVILPCMA